MAKKKTKSPPQLPPLVEGTEPEFEYADVFISSAWLWDNDPYNDPVLKLSFEKIFSDDEEVDEDGYRIKEDEFYEHLNGYFISATPIPGSLYHQLLTAVFNIDEMPDTDFCPGKLLYRYVRVVFKNKKYIHQFLPLLGITDKMRDDIVDAQSVRLTPYK